MENQFFHQVSDEPECTFFERITEDFLFWDDVRSNINCALLVWFRDNRKKKHGKNFNMVCDFFVEEEPKATFTAPFEVNKHIDVEKFQDICAMRLCSHLVKKAREELDKNAINAFSVSFVEQYGELLFL
jgi:hypothetical protein